MLSEHLLIAVLFSASILPLLAVWGRVVIPRRIGLIGMLAIWLGFPLAVVVTSFANREPSTDEEQVAYRPIAVESDGYVGSDSCRSCHPHHHATWYSSYHRTMTQVASRDSIIAPVNKGTRFESDGLESRLQWREDTLWASMEMPRERPDSIATITQPIVMTTGSHHMQIFWFRLRTDTRLLGMFPYVYLKEQQRWIPRGAAFLQPAFAMGDEVGRWNQTCIACHTTFGRTRPAKRVDPQSGEIYLDPMDPDSYVAEFGISCEACHGPGEAHTMANRDPAYRYRAHLSGDGDPTIVNPADLSHELKSQVCGQCHSVQYMKSDEWWTSGFTYRPGDDLEKSNLRFIVRVDSEPDANLRRVLANDPAFVDDHFWSDGMVRISGREYNGLLDSPCYQRGELSCLTCHQMHQRVDDDRDVQQWANDQLHPGMTGSEACVQCHQEFRDDAAVAQHTHHKVQSSGSNCYNCHMPYTTYGLLKAIRSHQIESPSVATSLSTGRPNACNQCHLDKTLAWTSQNLADWYGMDSPELPRDEQTIAASVLWLLRGDAGQRALMAWSFGWSDAQEISGTKWMAPYLAQLLKDPYVAVRFIAERSLRALDGHQDLNYDFLGEGSHIESAYRQVVKKWLDTDANPDEAVLIDRSGTLMRGEIERLLRDRNDRPITLVE
jgi:hypothetical protein